jgi:DNA repair protein RecO
MHSYTLEGIIIKRLNVGEADKIITLFSREMGKVSLKAAGIRKLQSKRAGPLELFNRVKVSAVRGRGNLDVLTEVDILDTFSSWKHHLGRVNIAYQLVEVIDKLTPDSQPHPQVFSILSGALSDINTLGPDWKDNLEDWFLDILKDLGYWPKEEEFSGDIYKFIEEIIGRPLHSPGILKKLSK